MSSSASAGIAPRPLTFPVLLPFGGVIDWRPGCCRAALDEALFSGHAPDPASAEVPAAAGVPEAGAVPGPASAGAAVAPARHEAGAPPAAAQGGEGGAAGRPRRKVVIRSRIGYARGGDAAGAAGSTPAAAPPPEYEVPVPTTCPMPLAAPAAAQSPCASETGSIAGAPASAAGSPSAGAASPAAAAAEDDASSAGSPPGSPAGLMPRPDATAEAQPPGPAVGEAEAALCRAKAREIRLDIPSTRQAAGGGFRARPVASDDSNGSTIATCGQARQGGGGGDSDSDDSITSPDADPAVAKHRGLPHFREAAAPGQQQQQREDVSVLEGRLAGMALRPQQEQEQEGESSA